MKSNYHIANRNFQCDQQINKLREEKSLLDTHKCKISNEFTCMISPHLPLYKHYKIENLNI